MEQRAQLTCRPAKAWAAYLDDSSLDCQDGVIGGGAKLNPPLVQAGFQGHSGELGISPLQLLLRAHGVRELIGRGARSRHAADAVHLQLHLQQGKF